ncbi:hypothetical protein [Slackia exigua]|uniref:hypothetical protein n=1 Tax=Slackia exigua TaxID=84109 RepID=UPI0028D38759|nr:hypothetical protein [Slackia exigua]
MAVMRIHNRFGGIVTFKEHIGSGDYRGIPFDLAVTTAPDGTLTGMPVVTFGEATVTFDLEDVLEQAYACAFYGDES